MSELKKLAVLFAILITFASSSPATAEDEYLKLWVGAGSESHTLAVFETDQANGKLRYIRQIEAVPTPMAIVIEPSR